MDARPSARGPATGMPTEISAFVGRRDDVGLIRRQLSATRLVTLTGVGGVGKTRLAVEGAGAIGGRFPGGVHMVELAALHDGDLLPQSIAAALGVHSVSAGDPHDVLIAHLKSRRTLIVLDNCEHLLDACVRTVDRLLRAVPELSVLVTSRQALRVTGEHVIAVQPLLTPVPGEPHSVRDLLRFPSVQLFDQRAAAILPGFQVGPDNAAVVAELLHRLDGIPLAIELAAARMRTLTLPEVLARLDECYTLLTLGSRAAAPRQRTLKDTIDWSHALCTEQEQALWARASVFSGGFDLSALESVCADDDLPQHVIVDLVNGLVEKSILVRREREGTSRYEMLETIRAYGYGQLAQAGELERFRRRHRDRYVDLTAQAEREWFSASQAEWFVRLRHDHANLRAALEFCLETPGETAKGLALAVAPRHYWITLGSLNEGRLWLKRLLANCPEDTTQPGRAAALATYAYLGILQGATEQALPILSEARITAEREGDRLTLAWLSHHRAVVAAWQHDYAEASTLLSEAASDLHALGDVGGGTECTMKRALAAAASGDQELTAELCAECDRLTSAHGESWIRGKTNFVRSLAGWQEADYRIAEAEALAAVRLLRPFDDWWGLAMSVEVLAGTAAMTGDPGRAATLFGVLDSLWKSIGGTLATAPFLLDARTRSEQAAHTALGTEAYDQAHRAGAALPVSSALAYALKQNAPNTATGGRARRPSQSDSSVLTPRELEVTDLVAEGLTNKEIAKQLHIVPRTAENHVERIFSKLGLSSRTQLAVWRHEHRDETRRG